MFKQLEELAANDQKAYYDLDPEMQEAFERQFAAWADENTSLVESYLLAQPIEFIGTLSLALTCISYYAENVEIILPVAKRVLNNKYDPEEMDVFNLQVLDDISAYDIFERNKTVYVQYIDMLIGKLNLDQDQDYLHYLIDVLSLAIVVPENQSEKQYFKTTWVTKLTEIANYGVLKNKLVARNLLKELGYTENIQPLTLLEKLKKIFGLS